MFQSAVTLVSERALLLPLSRELLPIQQLHAASRLALAKAGVH